MDGKKIKASNFQIFYLQSFSGQSDSQGPPGEISQAQLDSAISGTSANTNGVSTLDTAFADPDLEAMRQKLNEMILNGRR